MDLRIGLLVNGPPEWYENLIQQYSNFGGTWLAQDKELKPEFLKTFDQSIKGSLNNSAAKFAGLCPYLF